MAAKKAGAKERNSKKKRFHHQMSTELAAKSARRAAIEAQEVTLKAKMGAELKVKSKKMTAATEKLVLESNATCVTRSVEVYRGCEEREGKEAEAKAAAKETALKAEASKRTASYVSGIADLNNTAKIAYASAAAADLLPAPPPPPCVPVTSTFSGTACVGDDCLSSVSCPEGSRPTSCKSLGVTAGDGAFISDDMVCNAQGDHDTSVLAQITCTTCGVPSVSRSPDTGFVDNQQIIAECAAGLTAVDCNCNTRWVASTVCPGTSHGRFNPTAGKCELSIPSSAGRRRGVGGGAGAYLTALCVDNRTLAEPTPLRKSTASAGSAVTQLGSLAGSWAAAPEVSTAASATTGTPSSSCVLLGGLAFG